MPSKGLNLTTNLPSWINSTQIKTQICIPYIIPQLCLGLPWLVKSLMTGYDGGDWLVPVQSEGLAYTTISLLLSLILLYAILAASK